jgi:hypothetical protein
VSNDAANDNSDLCRNTALFAEIIGRGEAIWLVQQYLKWDRRGARGKSSSIYIPKKLKAGHPLIEHIGQENAAKLVRAFGEENFKVSSSPKPIRRKRNSAIRRWWEDGATIGEIAEGFELTPRQIRNITRKFAEDAEKQGVNDNAAAGVTAAQGGLIA